MNKRLEVLVVGASVAGAATALALARRGHTVRVFERRGGETALGAGVVLWPNASFVLSELGLLSEVRAVARTPPALRRYDDGGSALGAWDITLLDGAMGFPSLAVLRADLQRTLFAALRRAGVVVEHGRTASRVEACPDAPGRARVIWADGSLDAADLVVGADGRMGSVAGRYVRGQHTPVYQGFVNWVGTAETQDELFNDGAVHDYWGIGRRFGIVPVSAGRVYWAAGQAMVSPPPGEPRGEFHEELQRLVASWPPAVAAALAESRPENIRRIPLYDVEPQRPWHRGAVLLVGDAAHASLPTSGQGAAQALEDAWHLARLLDETRDGLDATLTTFAEVRFGKTRWMTQAARQLARSLFNEDPHACEQRNAAARAADHRNTVKTLAASWGEGLPLAGR
ncbi:MAG: NAD(P)/FAD-dependent oxidoreductase [Myxococcota bacterium]